MKSDEIIYCSRCGSEFNKSARYCMKCGNINYDHPENASMKKYEGNNKENVYQIGAGSSIKTNTSSDMMGIPTNTGNPTLFFIVNILVFCGIIIGYAGIVLLSCDFMLTAFLDSSFSGFCCLFSLMFLYVVSLELIFMKTNNYWWAALIPFYNCGVLAKITMKNSKLAVLYFIPIVGVVASFYSMFKLGKQFGYNGALCAIFSFISLPVIAFKTNSFNGITYLDANDRDAVEKDYKRRNTLLFIIIIFLLLGVMVFAFNNYNKIKSGASDVLGFKYVKTAEKILKETKKSIEEEKISCDDDSNKFVAGKTYYFYFEESYYEFGITTADGLVGNEMESFVKVKNENGKLIYSISISDGTYGFEETLEEDLDQDIVKKYKEVKKVNDQNIISCSRIS